MERRTFLSLIAAAAGAATAAVVAIPVVGHLLSPLLGRKSTEEAQWLPVGPLDDFEEGTPRRISVPVTARDGWETTTEDRSAFVVRKGAADVLVLSAVCPHLGCSVRWRGEGGQFQCPCHESGFDEDGTRKHGPARRGLDPLPSRIAGGRVEIQWVDYAANVAERRPVGGG